MSQRTCGHTASDRKNPPDFGCMHEKEGCGSKGLDMAAAKTASSSAGRVGNRVRPLSTLISDNKKPEINPDLKSVTAGTPRRETDGQVIEWLQAARRRPDADELFLHGSSAQFTAFAQPRTEIGALIFFTKLTGEFQPDRALQAEFYGANLYLCKLAKGVPFNPIRDPAAKSVMEEALGPNVYDRESKIKHGWLWYQDCHEVVPLAVDRGYTRFRVHEMSVRGDSHAVSNPALITIVDINHLEGHHFPQNKSNLSHVASVKWSSFPEEISAQDLIAYVRRIKKGSGFGGKEMFAGKIARVPYWTLSEFPLVNLHPDDLWNVRNMETLEHRFDPGVPSPAERIREYAEESSAFPPIVVDRKGRLIDGFHRVGAARLRGDTSIPAYRPMSQPASKKAPIVKDTKGNPPQNQSNLRHEAAGGPRFVWTANKAARNITKHKVRFDLAVKAFEDPGVQFLPDEDHRDAEERVYAIGKVPATGVLLVVFTDRTEEDEVETLHLISARKANAEERAFYERANGIR